MAKSYTKIIDALFTKTLDELIKTKEEFWDIKQVAPKILMLAVTNTDKSGVVFPAFDSLPYTVHIQNIKDRIISGYDLIFYFDQSFIDNCRTEKEIEALIWSCLNTIEICEGKDGDFVYENDGKPKMKNRPTDFILEGYSNSIKEYGIDSPEMKLFNQLMNENPELSESAE